MGNTTFPVDTGDALAALTDDELIDHVKDLVACERRASAALVRSLVELDSRRLYLREGCASLFTYCTQVLHLSEGSAYNRIEAARAARRFPQVIDALERGELTLTAVRMLAPHLTLRNHAEVLTAARHRSKEEIQDLIASLNPASDVTTVIRLHVTLTRETHQKLRRAQDLARHALPEGDLGSLLDRALTLLIEDLERRKFGLVESPRRGRTSDPTSRYIPAAVRRAVADRDQGRCAFIGRLGRCREMGFLEFHHVRPYADGGAATVENIQLRCRAHNQHEAREMFEDGPPACAPP